MTGDFLTSMAHASRARVAAARSLASEDHLHAQLEHTPAPPSLKLQAGFDLIAELKLRSPAAGILSAASDAIESRVQQYAQAGAAAVSVLTEPERFDGSLLHLARSTAMLSPLRVPVMRKDFITDYYQLLEARVNGASGVLLIVRMLRQVELEKLLMQAHALGLFVLLEAFDEVDIEIATALASNWAGDNSKCLIGVNSRDLRSLQIIPGHLEKLADRLPLAHPRVAESGLVTAEDAARLSAIGYTLALVGSALMSSAQPLRLVQDMISRGRAAAAMR